MFQKRDESIERLREDMNLAGDQLAGLLSANVDLDALPFGQLRALFSQLQVAMERARDLLTEFDEHKRAFLQAQMSRIPSVAGLKWISWDMARAARECNKISMSLRDARGELRKAVQEAHLV